MKVFNITNEEVSIGVKTNTVTVSNSNEKYDDSSYPVIMVGDLFGSDGTGSSAFVPIRLLPDVYREWKSGKEVLVTDVRLEKTRKGNPKFVQLRTGTESTHYIGIFRITSDKYQDANVIGDADTSKYVTIEGEYRYEHQNFPGQDLAVGTAIVGNPHHPKRFAYQIIAKLSYADIVCVQFGNHDHNKYLYVNDQNEASYISWDERLADNLF